MSEIKRRNLLLAGAVAASRPGLALTQSAISSGRIRGANDRVRVALIGCGNRGGADLKNSLAVSGTECVGLCDPDAAQSAKVLKGVVEPLSQRPSLITQDFRRLLDLKDLDAVIVATPDHWHALCATMACQAGKDVYLEKPLALTIAEGGAIVRAVQRYARVVQVGNQRRSGSRYLPVADYLKTGKLGKIRCVRTWAYLDWVRWVPSVPDEDPPASVDYDMWLGPAPTRPFNRNRFHFNWRWFWDYGNGLTTDWGAHIVDLSLWVMGINDAPLSAVAMGGKLGDANDSMETPDTLHAIWQYPGFTMSWEHAIGIGRGPEACEHGVEIHGNDGVLVIDPRGWRVYSETRNHGRERRIEEVAPQQFTGGEPTPRHHENFLSCVRSRQKPNSPVESAYKAMLACHLANIAYRTGRSVRWDAASESIPDAEAQRLIMREYRGQWKLG